MSQFKRLAGVLEAEMVNTGKGELNSGCGADFVKVSQAVPTGMTLTEGVRCVSVDDLNYIRTRESSSFLE